MDLSGAGEISPEEFLECLKELQKMKEANEKYLLELHESQRRELTDEKLRFLNSLCTSNELSGSILLDDDLYENCDISKESKLVCTPNDLLNTPNNLSVIDECLNNSTKSRNSQQSVSSLKHQVLPKVNIERIIDEVPIVPKFDDFNALLETELQNESNKKIIETPKTRQPKKYLKKGEGMRRFKMTRDDIGQTKTKLPWLKTKQPKCCPKNEKVETNDAKVPLKSSKKQLCFSSNKPVSEIESIDFHHIPENKTWASILGRENTEYENDRNYASDTSISMSPSVTKVASKKEMAEQNMFDLIEKKVANTSFSSTNSFFAKILGSCNSSENEKCSEIEKHLLELNPLPTEVISRRNDSSPYFDKQINEFSENNDFAQKSDSEAINNYDNDKNESSDSEDTTVSSISEETCRIVDKAISTSTPNQNFVPNFGKKVHIVDTKNNDFKKKNIIITLINNNDTTCTEDTSEVRTLTESCTYEENESNVRDDAYQKVGKIFELRIKELEKDVNILRNNNVQLKEELEIKKRELLEERAKFETKSNEEKVIAEYYLAEEREKLQKKMSFYDRHIRDIKGQLSRKEKEEQILLSKEITELKEQLEAKNAKHGALQARLRNQIKSLENENKVLKEECEKLKKENRKLKSSNARTNKLTNIKLLAEINKSLILKSSENENFESHKGVSTESLNSCGKKQVENVNQKTAKHKLRTRTKSAPNINVTSRYAKFFSEKDNPKEFQSGYGLDSEEESDGDLNVLNTSFDREKELITFPQVSDFPNTTTDEYSKYDLLNNVKENKLIGNNYTKSHNPLHICEPHEKIDLPKPRTPLLETQNFNIPETTNENLGSDKTETVKSDGSIDIKFSNGNHKTISADGSYSKFVFYNGDIKEIFYKDGIVKYFYKERNIHQTLYKDGSEVLHFPEFVNISIKYHILRKRISYCSIFAVITLNVDILMVLYNLTFQTELSNG